MELEYSNEIKGRVFAYRFFDFEKKHIAKALIPVVKKLTNKIKRIEDDPNNEGQVTYAVKIDAIRKEINCIEEIIKTFGGG